MVLKDSIVLTYEEKINLSGPQNYLEPTHFNDADLGKNRFTWKIILPVKLTQIN